MMSLFSKRVLPLTLLGAAAVLGGCVGEASLEGDDAQETQPEATEAADPESADAIDPDAAEAVDPDAAEAVGTAQQALSLTYECWWGPFWVGDVTIWWGNNTREWDAAAEWACNEWISWCVSSGSPGGCWVAPKVYR
ncbi:hypothetical protein [Sorangium sp. So ce887]|uniref:hypothetical protein n=1 Tax=Sorangium sp. So ce887 TaxID=3133324 RepID=UPI003F607278